MGISDRGDHQRRAHDRVTILRELPGERLISRL